MTIYRFEDFMKYTKFFYICVGIEPYKKVKRETSKNVINNSKQQQINAANFESSNTVLQNIIFYANIGNLLAILIGEALFTLVCFTSGEHFEEAIMCLSYIGFGMMAMSKLIIVNGKKTTLSYLIHELTELFPYELQLQQNYRLYNYVNFCSRVSLTFSLLYTVLIWTYNLFAPIQYLIYDYWLEIRALGETLPYFMYVPWQWEGHWSYWLLVASQNVAGYTTAACQASTDLFLCAIATQVIMHYDFTARQIKEYKPTPNWEDNKKFLAEKIRIHEKLLRISQALNDIFGLPLLMNFFISNFIICFVGFQMTIGVPSDVFFKLILFLIACLSQVFLICHYGQRLIKASLGIAEAAYEQNWYNSDLRYRKMLIIIMQRAQNPAYLKATIFVNISQATMTDILQISYRFFALLRNLYKK